MIRRNGVATAIFALKREDPRKRSQSTDERIHLWISHGAHRYWCAVATSSHSLILPSGWKPLNTQSGSQHNSWATCTCQGSHMQCPSWSILTKGETSSQFCLHNVQIARYQKEKDHSLPPSFRWYGWKVQPHAWDTTIQVCRPQSKGLGLAYPLPCDGISISWSCAGTRNTIDLIFGRSEEELHSGASDYTHALQERLEKTQKFAREHLETMSSRTKQKHDL